MNDDQGESGSPDAALREGQRHVRRARIAAAIAVGAIIGHLEYLVFPYVTTIHPLRAVLIFLYPFALGALVLAGLFGRGRGIRR